MPKSQKTGSERFGRRIRERRQELGLRRRDLVELTGLSYPYVSQIETGYRLPSDRALRDLAAALQLDSDDLAASLPADRRTTVPPLTPTGASTGSAPSWVSNPAFARLMSPEPPRRLPGTVKTGVVAAAVALLEQLAPDMRLDAMADVQRAVLEGLIQDQTGRN